MYFASSNSIFIDFWHLRMRENGWYLKTNNGTLTECATKLNVLYSMLWATAVHSICEPYRCAHNYPE